MSLIKIETMSDIIISQKNKSGKKYLPKPTRVDLTPMVDLGFLLITFFIFNTSIQQPTKMNLVMPKDSTDSIFVATSSALTFILNSNNSISYYDGFDNKVNSASFGSMRNIIQQKKFSLKAYHINTKELTIILKPTKESTYKNLIDALDEITINDCRHYFIAKAE